MGLVRDKRGNFKVINGQFKKVLTNAILFSMKRQELGPRLLRKFSRARIFQFKVNPLKGGEMSQKKIVSLGGDGVGPEIMEVT